MTFLVSSTQQSRLRSPHKARLYMSVYHPAVIYAAQVNQVGIQRGARTITYNNAVGSLSDVLGLFTLWVGTTAGANDLGKVRLKSINDTQMTVAENSIVWSNGGYLTIIREVGIWSVWPRLNNKIILKDYDVTYVDQTKFFTPTLECGPDRAGFLDGGSLVFPVDMSGSYCFGSTISSFSATAYPSSGTSISINSSTGIGTITMTTAGERLIRFSATAANGKSYDTFRVYIAHPRYGEGAPITDFKLTSPISGRVDQPGFSTRFEVSGSASLTEFPDNATVIIWKEDEYADSTDPVALDAYGSILFNGFLRQDQFVHGEPQSKKGTTFEATTIGHLLTRHRMFSVPINAHHNPKHWYQFKAGQLTPGAAIWFLVKEHSTAMRRSDWIGLNSDAIYLKAVDFMQGNLFSQASGLAKDTSILAQFSSDNKGRMYFQRNAQYMDQTDRDALDEVMEIDQPDLEGALSVVRRPEYGTSMSHLSGFNFVPGSMVSTALISKAPGDAPEWVGENIVNVERQVLLTQDQANKLVGRIHAYHNATDKEFRLNFRGDYSGVFTTLPQRWYRMTIDGSLNNRNISIENGRFLCTELSLEYDNQVGEVITSVILEREVFAQDGVTGDYPTSMPTPSLPPITWPSVDINPDPFHEVDGPPPTEINPPVDEESMYPLVGWGSCQYIEDLTEGWRDISGDLSGEDAVHGTIQPFWGNQSGTSPRNAVLFTIQDGKVLMSNNGGDTWKDITPTNAPPNDSNDPTPPDMTNIVPKQVYCSLTGKLLVLYEYDAGTAWRGWVAVSTDYGETTWQWITLFSAPLSDGTYYYPKAFYHFTNETNFVGGPNTLSTFSDDGRVTVANASKGAGLPDGIGAEFDFIYGTYTTYLYMTSLDAGLSGGSMTLAVRAYSPNLGFYRNPQLWVSSDGFTWIRADVLGWGGESEGDWIWSSAVTVPLGYQPLRHVALRFEPPWGYGSPGYPHGFVDSFRVGNVEEVEGGQLRPQWLDVNADETKLAVTGWDGIGLSLSVLDITDLAEIPQATPISLGVCDETEFDTGIYAAYPAFLPRSNDYVVYGRMNNPQALGGIVQMLKYQGGFEVVVGGDNGWGADRCGSVKFYNPKGSTRVYTYALRLAAAESVNAYTFDSDAESWLVGLYSAVNGADDPGMAAAQHDAADGSPDDGCIYQTVAASISQYLICKKLGHTYRTYGGDILTFSYKVDVTGSCNVFIKDLVTNTIIGPITADTDWTDVSYELDTGLEFTTLSFLIYDTTGTGTFTVKLDSVELGGSAGAIIYMDAGAQWTMLGFNPVPVSSVYPDGMAVRKTGLVAIASGDAGVAVKGIPGRWTDISSGLTGGTKSLRWL